MDSVILVYGTKGEGLSKSILHNTIKNSKLKDARLLRVLWEIYRYYAWNYSSIRNKNIDIVVTSYP